MIPPTEWMKVNLTACRGHELALMVMQCKKWGFRQPTFEDDTHRRRWLRECRGMAIDGLLSVRQPASADHMSAQPKPKSPVNAVFDDFPPLSFDLYGV